MLVKPAKTSLTTRRKRGIDMVLKNIVLIGIMGCGKTTIGQMLAENLGMGFLDLDQYIEAKWGSIPTLFQQGEDYFRNIESRAVTDVSNNKDMVIATGGGVVKREGNIPLLKQNGVIFFIDRPLQSILSDIDTQERPLLKNGKEKLVRIFNERYSLYTKLCDIHIRNTGNIETVVYEITSLWRKHRANP